MRNNERLTQKCCSWTVYFSYYQTYIIFNTDHCGQQYVPLKGHRAWVHLQQSKSCLSGCVTPLDVLVTTLTTLSPSVDVPSSSRVPRIGHMNRKHCAVYTESLTASATRQTKETQNVITYVWNSYCRMSAGFNPIRYRQNYGSNVMYFRNFKLDIK